MRHFLPSLASLVILLALAGWARAAIEHADVTGGRLKGEVADGIASFKGVPFAAPPVGALRWKAPQPVLAWSRTRNANTFAPACVVWIHGGGSKSGMSWEDVSHGTKLAPEGVVLVTIAYRFGAIGFLAYPELTRESGKSSGNYGLMGVVAPLKWVHANIAQFGGDASRVTIFGGTAGGVAVSLLADAPAAEGSTGSRQLPDVEGLRAWGAHIQCATPMSAGRFLYEDVC